MNREAKTYAEQLRREHGFYELREMFVKREADERFAEIGRMALRERWPQDEHHYVWVGYQLATESKYITG